jgi:hypothetical protein
MLSSSEGLSPGKLSAVPRICYALFHFYSLLTIGKLVHKNEILLFKYVELSKMSPFAEVI